jgi:hypothetical protein
MYSHDSGGVENLHGFVNLLHIQVFLGRAQELCFKRISDYFEGSTRQGCSLTDAPIVLLRSEETVHEDYSPRSIGGGFRGLVEVVYERYSGS